MNFKTVSSTTLLTSALLFLAVSFNAQAAPGEPVFLFNPGGGQNTPPGLDPDFTPPGRDPNFSPPRREASEARGGNGHGPNNGGSAPFCGRPAGGGPPGQAGLSSIAHLDFSSLEPADEDAAAGRLMYRWYAPVFDFVFNARNLPIGEEYTLTYQPQPLPSAGVICLGAGAVNEEGDLHLQDAFDIATDLPAAYDENEDEAILALVLSADVDCEAGTMAQWQDDAYLFGDEGMFYVRPVAEDDDDDDDNGED